METCYPDTEVTATGIIFARPALVSKVLVITSGSADCKWVIHDSATVASGTVLGEFAADVAVDHVKSFDFNPPLECKAGMYGTLTGTGGSVIVYEIQ